MKATFDVEQVDVWQLSLCEDWKALARAANALKDSSKDCAAVHAKLGRYEQGSVRVRTEGSEPNSF
jgi:hypothetical protein